MRINVEVGISRTSRDEIHIRLLDVASHKQFVDVTMTPHDFAMALTGLWGIKVDAEVAGLDVIGKNKVTERRSIACPIDTYSREALEKWLVDNAQEEGWSVVPYLGSQSSIYRKDGTIVLNYSVTRYEEVTSVT